MEDYHEQDYNFQAKLYMNQVLSFLMHLDQALFMINFHIQLEYIVLQLEDQFNYILVVIRYQRGFQDKCFKYYSIDLEIQLQLQ
ncbi:unnamed protein product [Paramecium sonneborni]|uniref:Uncharacterized protein n=1 Tax=Paramecium sonneborni TaxID=65129 RepID=A0A8S1R8G6_9CILI|nr:unnamed protein product [Paramecium sonneborni]